MKHVLPLLIMLFISHAAFSQSSAAPQTIAPLTILPAQDVDLEQFMWRNRVIVVFADAQADPRFEEQMQRLMNDKAALLERDIIIITDTDPSQKSKIRQQLRPRGFALVLIGKDSTVKLRKPFAWSVRELSRTIDKMPLRQEEIRNRS